MSRKRDISPRFFTDEDLVDLPFEYRLLFAGLWTLADREGRLDDRPTRIRMELFPADNVDVRAGVDALATCGKVVRYSVEGRNYIVIPGFAKNQNVHPKEAPSRLPAPPGTTSCAVMDAPKRVALTFMDDLQTAVLPPMHEPKAAVVTPVHDPESAASRDLRAMQGGVNHSGPSTGTSTRSFRTAPLGVHRDRQTTSDDVDGAAVIAIGGEVSETVTAQAVVRWYAEAMALIPLVATGQQKARVGKAAKVLLDAGADVQVLRHAIAEAARRNRVDLIETIYGDLERAAKGIDRAPPPPPRAPHENPIDKRNREWREAHGFAEDDPFGIRAMRDREHSNGRGDHGRAN